MKIVTKRDVMQLAIATFGTTYPLGRDYSGYSWPVEAIRKRIGALNPETFSQAEFHAAVSPLKGWGANDCDECNEDSDTLVHFGDEPDYEARWQRLCVTCLNRGIYLLLPKFPHHEKP